MATKNELRIRAREVKNETELGHNTANRIGDLFYDVVNKLLDETPYTKKEVQDLIEGVTEDFYNEIQEVNNGLNKEENRLTELLTTLNSQISDQVNTMFEDKNWLSNEMVGVQVESNFGDEDVDKYLQRIGIVERNEQGEATSWAWSSIEQTTDSLTTQVNSISQKQSSDYTALQSQITQAVNDEDQSVRTDIDNTYSKIADVDGVKEVLGWMYSGIKTGAAKDTSFADIISAGTSGVDTAISNLHTAIIQDADGRYTSEAAVSTMINNSMSGLVLRSEYDETSNTLFSKLGETNQGLSSLSTRVTQMENGEFISTSSLVSAVAEEKNGIASVLSSAGLVNAATLQEATTELSSQIDGVESTVYTHVSSDIASAGFLVEGDDGTKAYIEGVISDDSSEVHIGADKIFLNANETLVNTIRATQGTIAGWEISENKLSKKTTDSADQSVNSISLEPLKPQIVVAKEKNNIKHSTVVDDEGFVTVTTNERNISTTTNKINNDGSGTLGTGGISWDNEGKFAFTSEVIGSLFTALSQGIEIEDLGQFYKINFSPKELKYRYILNAQYGSDDLSLSANLIRITHIPPVGASSRYVDIANDSITLQSTESNVTKKTTITPDNVKAPSVAANSFSFIDSRGSTHEGWSGYLPLKLSDGTEIELYIDGGIITSVEGI